MPSTEKIDDFCAGMLSMLSSTWRLRLCPYIIGDCNMLDCTLSMPAQQSSCRLLQY